MVDGTFPVGPIGIRLHCKKRLGELMAEQKRTVGLSTGERGGRPSKKVGGMRGCSPPSFRAAASLPSRKSTASANVHKRRSRRCRCRSRRGSTEDRLRLRAPARRRERAHVTKPALLRFGSDVGAQR